MARNDRTTAGPYWTKHWIEKMWRFTAENFVNFDTGDVDFEALGREEYEFRKALFYRNFKNSERAKEAFVETEEGYKSHVESGKKGGRPKKSPQDAPNGNAGEESSDAGNGAASKSPTSCDTFTADGDTREDSLNVTDGSNAALLESGTSANLYGDAATSEGADVSTTVSRNMRRVPQTEAPAHGFSGGRTAQGTMSRSPEAAAQSGKDYDQETAQVSTDAGEASSREAEDVSTTFSGADFTALQCRQVSATADALESQGRAGAQALAVRNLPRNKEEVRLFAIDNGLDVDDANDWAEMNLRERHGRDKDGKPIRNWKGAIRNYCKAMAAKRETA